MISPCPRSTLFPYTTLFRSSLKDYEVITPDYEQAFLNIDYSKFDHALKTFKNTKSFFEKNEREKMKDMFYEILDDESKIYLDENEVIKIGRASCRERVEKQFEIERK